MNRFPRVIGALVASGALAITGVAAAHADASSSTGSSTTSVSAAPAPSPAPRDHRDRCAKAAERIAELTARRSRVESRIDRLGKARAAALAQHHEEAAKKIEARIDRAKKMRERISDRIRRIERRCRIGAGGSGGSGGSVPPAPAPAPSPAPAPAPAN
ncbi:MAG: hypothetical protein ACYDAD_14560 [Acidimicrobiales bacterium]